MGWFSKLKEGLSKSSENITSSIKLAVTGKKLNDETLEELEESLIIADVGVEASMSLIAKLRKSKFDKEITDEEVREFLASEIGKILAPCQQEFIIEKPTNGPYVILMVGVNGSGKTTTIGKLAAKLKDEGKSVMLAAGDTFRAGAVEQLAVWADRNNVPIVKPAKEGADPAGVIFNAYEQAVNENIDVLIADTAGRLQNRTELMDELAKITRVIKKHDETAPHSSLLVLDSTVGQNAHSQVTAFKETAGVTGLIITKLDSTAKGGVVVALAEKFKLPIHFIGIGESKEDLRNFEANDYAKALMGITK